MAEDTMFFSTLYDSVCPLLYFIPSLINLIKVEYVAVKVCEHVPLEELLLAV